MNRTASFTYSYFKVLLLAAKPHFEFQMFAKAPDVVSRPPRKAIFLRHDVDLCLEKALCMAQVENSVGVPATYMVSIDSPLYSLECEFQLNIVKKIAELGHDIGLHHIMDDKPTDEGAIDQLETSMNLARQKLERLIAGPVNSFSFHRPTPEVLRGPLVMNGMVNAYSRELMACYLSDSAGTWKGRDPLAHILSPRGQLLQLLVHPLWWGEFHMDADDRLQEFYENRTQGSSIGDAEAFDNILLSHLARVRRRGFNSRPTEIDDIPQIMAQRSVARA